MNRLIKLILYITAGCVGIGCASLILGFALGGGRILEEDSNALFGKAREAMHDMAAEKRAKTEAVAVEEGTENVVDEYTYTDQGVHALSEADVYEEGLDEEDFYGERGILTVDASGISSLDVNLQHGYLLVTDSEDSRIRVSVSESDDITAECVSGQIIIRDDRTGTSAREDASVYLEIPDGLWLDTVNIQLNAAYMEAECGFQVSDLVVHADAGEISLCDITADTFAASVGAGCMDIEDGEFGSVQLNCGLGTIDIEADIKGDSQIECGMGAVDVELMYGPESVNYAVSCGAGSIEIGDHTYSGLSKKSRIENGAPATFTLKCGMGQICID